MLEMSPPAGSKARGSIGAAARYGSPGRGGGNPSPTWIEVAESATSRWLDPADAGDRPH